MDIKSQLIEYLQKVIKSRIECKRNCFVSSLLGHINSHQLKHWFRNQYKREITSN